MIFTPNKENPPPDFLAINNPFQLDGNVIALVGKNGSGKTKLFTSIMSREFFVEENGQRIENIVFIAANQIQPQLDFTLNEIAIISNINLSYQIYDKNRDIFRQPQTSWHRALSKLSPNSANLLPNIYRAIEFAADITKKSFHDLNEEDFLNSFSQSLSMPIGTLKINELIYEYIERMEKNKYREYRNSQYNEGFITYNSAEFIEKYGRPPWEIFDEALRLVLDNRYSFPSPNIKDKKCIYHLLRNDGVQIKPQDFSSGEKTLLWLALCLYPLHKEKTGHIPDLLLIDEPDSNLHPGMIEKFHAIIKMISDNFKCKIIFTTHSPTTISLFESDKIYTKSLTGIAKSYDKDEVISDLLIGVNRVAINYSNQKQVYVESFNDCRIYEELFAVVKNSGKIAPSAISLKFIPATPKYPVSFIENEVKKFFKDQPVEKISLFIESLNGQGNSAQVISTIESLLEKGNKSVVGVIDWDKKNKPSKNIYIHGENIFYTMENAILNPLTFGIYLLNSHPEKVKPEHFGLNKDVEIVSLFNSPELWQIISDEVTKKVLSLTDIKKDVECEFINGAKIYFDTRYVHGNGHELEKTIKSKILFPFLLGLPKNSSLVLDVISLAIRNCKGKTLPITFLNLFNELRKIH